MQASSRTVTPVVAGDSAVGFDPTVGVVTEGVTLLVEGTVTADRRYVQMNVDAGVARIDGFGQQAVTAVAGGQLVNSATAQSFIQLPKVTVTRVRTTVTVPDQGTLLMGGQRLVTESEWRPASPSSPRSPSSTGFFTNRIESREEQTLLILVKPTILIQNEEEEKNFPGLLDSYRTASAAEPGSNPANQAGPLPPGAALSLSGPVRAPQATLTAPGRYTGSGRALRPAGDSTGHRIRTI